MVPKYRRFNSKERKFMVPFTYLIGWTTQNKWYYGVRYSNGCSPADLWSIYYTSSKRVAQARKDWGEPDVIEVRRIFDCEKKARLWEENVLKRMNVLRDDRWLNRNISGAFAPTSGEEHPNYGKSWQWDAETCAAQSARLKGKKKSEEHKARIAASRRNESQESRQRRSVSRMGNKNPMWGKQTSSLQKQRVSEAMKGVPKNRSKVECPHCTKIGDQSLMTRYHFNNCKIKKAGK